MEWAGGTEATEDTRSCICTTDRLTDRIAASFMNPALNWEVRALFLCSYFAGLVFFLGGREGGTSADLAFLDKNYITKQ